MIFMHILKKAELPQFGQTYLYDGETGDRFSSTSNCRCDLYVEIITHG